MNNDITPVGRTTLRELYADPRLKGAVDLSQLDAATLEIAGDISVLLNDSAPRSEAARLPG